MKITAVVDSTCLIGLERIGHLDILPALLEPVLAPPAVASEFGSRPQWLTVETPTNSGTIAVLNLVVDAGEAEAIALANERGCRIILDDRKARMVARQLGLSITGTVGLLLRAKKTDVIPLVRPLLDSLNTHGFHISGALRIEALRLAGE